METKPFIAIYMISTQNQDLKANYMQRFAYWFQLRNKFQGSAQYWFALMKLLNEFSFSLDKICKGGLIWE